MAEKIVFGIDIETGQAAQSFSGIKSELKALQKAIGEIDPNSKAFEVATQRAGALREKIRGVNDAIENADPEKKFAPFARTVQGLAGGFSAAQGAMALFGGESKDLEKTLVKVQGAMALSQGLNSLLEFKNDFKELGGTIVKNVVKAFTTLKGAIIATGIGAAAVAVGILIVNWKQFSAAITNAFPGFKVVTDFFKNLRQIGAGTLAGIVEGFKVLGEVVSLVFQRKFSEAIVTAKQFGARIATETNKAYAEEDRKVKIENGLADRDFALKLEEAKGKDVRAKRIQLMKDELSILEEGSDEYNAKLIEIETLRTELRKEAAEKQKKIDDGNAAYAKEADKRMKILADEAWQSEIDAMMNHAQTKLSLSEEEANALLKTRKLTDEEIAKMAFMSYSEQLAYLKKLAEDEKIIDEKKAQAKIDSLKMISASLTQFAELAGKETAAGKALAVASATIDTYVGASAAYAAAAKIDPFVLAPLAAAGAIAAGLARVKAIVAVKVPGGSSSSGGTTAPSVPQFNPAVAQQVQGGGDIQLGLKPQKVYVVESDIRGTMNKVDVIQANATIG